MEKNLEKFSINKLEELINDITSIVYDEKIWIGQEMWKIAEVTYSYVNNNDETNEKLTLNGKEVNLNTTLFVSLGELDLDNFIKACDEDKIKEINKASKKIRKKIKTKIKEIEISKDLIKKINIKKLSSTNKNKIKILKNSLNEKISFLEYCLNGLIYEEEKAGLIIELDSIEEQKINKKQQKLDKKLFGGQIIDNPKEVEICYNRIKDLYDENKHKINEDEQKKFVFFIEKLTKYLPKSYKYEKIETKYNHLSDFFKYKMSQKDYILGFNLFIEAFKKMDFNVEVNPYVKSISDGPHGFQIPNTQNFDFFDFPRFLALNAHENETHNISEHNSQLLIGNIRGKGSTTKDEGAAILMENMLKYGEQIFKIDKKSNKKIIDIQKLEFNSNFIKILFGEILDNNQLIEFLIISNKLEKDIISVKDRLFRLKRSNKAGVQHKDTSYTRGLFEAAKQINKYILTNGKKGINFEHLFLGKVGFDEINLLIEIKEASNTKKIIKPMFYSDIVFLAIKQRMDGKEIDEEDLIKTLSKKYPIIDFQNYGINLVSNRTIISIDGIINLCLKNIYTHNTEEERQKIKIEVLDILGENISYNEEKIKSALNGLNKMRKNALIKK